MGTNQKNITKNSSYNIIYVLMDLIQAASNGDIRRVHELFEQGVDPNIRNQFDMIDEIPHNLEQYSSDKRSKGGKRRKKKNKT